MIPRRTFAAGALALAAAPFAAQAQAPGKTYRIAVWNLARPVAELSSDGAPEYRAFFAELSRLGFDERRNLTVDRYSSEGQPERYDETARNILDARPDVVVLTGTVGARPLMAISRTVPIVAATMLDPVALGFVSSLARPGGNLTGFTLDAGIELESLRLQLLRDAVPGTSRLALLTTEGRLYPPLVQVLREAASVLGVNLSIHAMTGLLDEANYRATFARIAAEQAQGLYVWQAAEHLPYRGLITALAAAHRLPAIYPFGEYVEEGGLISYGANRADNFRRAAGYVARVLNGEKPGDLPIQQPTVFDVIVNLKTAKALGITIPESIMIRATEVIE